MPPKDLEKTSFLPFIISTYILPIILNVMRGGFIQQEELQFDNLVLDYGRELYEIFIQMKYIEEDLGVLVKKGKKCEFIAFEMVNQFHQTFRRFGFFGDNSIEGQIPEDLEKHILSRYQGIGDKVLHWLPYYLLALMTISIPDSKIKHFSFPRFRDIECAFLERFLGYIIEAVEGRYAKDPSEITENRNFFALISKDEVISILSRGKEDILNAMRNEPAISQDLFLIIEQLDMNHILEILTSSPEKPQLYPILVEAAGKYAIGPYALIMTRHLLSARYNRKKMNKILNEFTEPKFENEVIEILCQNKIRIEDDSAPPIELLRIEKKNNFEIDILGRKDEILFVIELKSFDLHPYFFSKKERTGRLKSKYRSFEKNFYEKHIPFFKEFFRGNVRPGLKRSFQFRRNKQATITPVQFDSDFKPKIIVPLYVNEIREYPEGDWKINIVNISLLNKFLQAPTTSWIMLPFP